LIKINPKTKDMKIRIILLAIALLSVINLNAQIKIISSGKVGIGTDTPIEKLQINGSIRGDQSGALKISTGYGYITVGPTNTSFAHFTTDNQRFYFNKIILLGTGKISTYSTYDLQLCTGHNSETTRMTISASTGNVGIGVSPHTTAKLNVGGDIAINGTVKVTSDIRLKENIKTMDNRFNKIALLQPITFNYKSDINDNTLSIVSTSDSANVEVDAISKRLNDDFCKQTRYGFSAQDVQKIYPELVTQDANGYLSVDYIGLIPVLVEAIKEQQDKITELEKKINTLSRGKTY
jgi:hypothetical protein